jgi:polyisoprenoid-binding protein YceI
MTVKPGTHTLGPAAGSCRVHTYREGMAQKVGHDLIIEVGQWEARVEVGEEGVPTSIWFRADPRSLQVLEGHRGVKPLTDSDREDIRANIDKKVLRGQPIEFTSTAVESRDGRLSVEGPLTLGGSTKPARFELELGDDGRVRGTLPVTQSEWGIKPYRAFMGALKVRDTVEVVLDAALPSA